jgi:uncharacterized lipoprotein YajG
MTAGRPVPRLTLWAIVTFLALGGCSSSAVLDVGYPTVTNTPMLPSAQARRVVIRPVVDRRVDTTRIGSASKDGHAVVTRRPVADIVREALVGEMTKAGYPVVAERWDVAVSAEVEEFWIDVVSGYKTALYVGRVVIALAVVDGSSGEQILVRRYVGISRRETNEGPKKAGRDALDAALARTMHDVATDPTVRAALASPPDRPSQS